ncbi:MAG TPA: NAD(P)-dependent oxidoreductase [Xanthobacteraceae bacterium]|nr:NAD(P)-dependent oxidoreductase [Xanthobacteraceae bacterium]
MHVGFIGLGIMGAPMALNIAKRGHRLTVYNRTPDKARAVVEAGATLAKTPHDIGDVDVLMTCVADGAAEDAIFFGHGLIDQLPKSCVHVSCTTMGIDSARKLTAEHGKRGRAFVAAPVLGRAVDMAPAGKLFVIAAGPAEALKRCAPLFEAVGQRTFEFGAEPERAIAVKLAVNFMGLTNIEGMAEAFALTGQYGVQKSAFYEFITSTLFGTPLYKSYGKLIEQDTFKPANFAVPLGLKDIKLAIDAGEKVNLAMPAAGVVRDHLVQALAQGYGEEDWSVIARVITNGLKAPQR